MKRKCISIENISFDWKKFEIKSVARISVSKLDIDSEDSGVSS